MPNTQQLNQKQREGFEKTLRELLHRAKKDMENATDVARPKVISKLLELRGAEGIAKQLLELDRKLTAMTASFEQLGFVLQDGEVCIPHHPSDEITDAYEKLLDEATVRESSKVVRLEDAIQNSWTVTTLAEAKKLIDSFA